VRLLLDTRIFLWAHTDRARIGTTMAVLEDSANDLLLSAVVAWEIAIKHAVGRMPLPQPPASYVPDRMSAIGAQPVPVSHAHALGVASLPLLHRDPFDRLLVAQAIQLGATLVTADPVLADYPAETLLV
jgi:PIN domain nuclease of toxin-antitoxin system